MFPFPNPDKTQGLAGHFDSHLVAPANFVTMNKEFPFPKAGHFDSHKRNGEENE